MRPNVRVHTNTRACAMHIVLANMRVRTLQIENIADDNTVFFFLSFSELQFFKNESC